MSITQLTLAGTPEQMGRTYGRALKEQIHALAAERLRLTLRDLTLIGKHAGADEMLALARRMLEAQASWRADIHAEFMGIARGAGIDPALLLIANGYTDFRDVAMQSTHSYLSECTSFTVQSAATETGRPYCGQTWDMHATAEPYIVVIRREPDDGPRTLSLTTAGCLSLVGINDAGVAIGNNNLVPGDARIGVIYLSMIHAALGCDELQSAQQVITSAPRASGHHYYLAGPSGAQCGIETTAKRHHVFDPVDGIYAHANHYCKSELAGGPVVANSTLRQTHAERRLRTQTGQLTVRHLQEMLEDRSGEPDCLCRYGDEQTSGGDRRVPSARTCAAVVLDPTERGFWATKGPPDQGEWAWYGLR